jgi:transposase
LVTDELWEIVEPLLPPEPPKPRGGRPRVPHRAALTGIVFVLKTGIPWEMLPKEMGCGSGSTCWRRLRDWQEAGVWERLHRALLDRLGQADEIDWSRACLDSASVPAKGARRLARTRRIAANRARSATLFRTEGVPLAVVLTGANVHDSKVLEEAVDAIKPIKRPLGKPGRPRKRPAKLHADKGYDFPRCRKALRKRGIKARLARCGIDSSEKLGRHRWVWSARRHGSPATASCRCATNGATKSTKRSSIWAARSSASTT